MTAYLKRFISLHVRSTIVLKDLKGRRGMTLYADFHEIYTFLRDVMKEGYRAHGKSLTNNDVHTILRVVWGRSKQLLKDEKKKKYSL